MDHVYTLLMLIITSSVLCGHVPAPVNLTMKSQHFIYLLTWEAGPDSPEGLHYNVIVHFLNEPGWKTVKGCQAVRYPLLCNLTDVFSDLFETYYINVTAVFENEKSTPISYPPFKPSSDTVAELPSLHVSPCNDSLCVYLQSPSERLVSIYKDFEYTFNVTSEKGDQFSPLVINTKGLDTINLKVVPGLQYCVSVNFIGRSPANKPRVCASVPVVVENTDAVISGILCLLALVIVAIVVLLLFKRSLHLKTRQLLVLMSFDAPYNVQIIVWPSAVSLTCVSLEPKLYEDVQVNEEADQEKEDEEVAYEGRRGCEEVVSCEETRSSLSLSPESQYEHSHNPVTETHTPDPRTFLKADMITFHQESLNQTSQILTTRPLPLNTPFHVLKENDVALIRHNTGDELRQEEEEEEDKEDSDSVNFFSLTIGGQNSDLQEETEKEEKTENMKKVKPEVPLCVLQPPEPARGIQPTYSNSTNKCMSYSDEDGEEDTEEEDAFSAYITRNSVCK